MNEQSEYPKMMFGEELMTSTAQGADIMMEMVQSSLMNQEMPPQPIWQWFVMHTVYRFVLEEYEAVYHAQPDSAERLQVYQEHVALVHAMLVSQKQFGLQAQVERILKTRLMHLPPGYVNALGL